MINAKKDHRFEKIFYYYQQYYLIPKHFSLVSSKGELDEEQHLPTIYIANHSSWWDGLLLFQLTQKTSMEDHYIMMTEEGLKQYRFFRKLGAYSVRRDHPKDLIQSLRYTQTLLEHGKKVWLFPQGSIQHQHIPDYQFMRGIGLLLSMFDQVMIKPVTFHYYFHERQKPIAAIDIGKGQLIHGTDAKDSLVHQCESLLQGQRQSQLKRLIDQPEAPFHAPYHPIITPSLSTSDRFNRLMRRGS
ncbi:lysophospholipid acyltransferase family protein [Gracilibacillus massiliensis]|uniref:lysophospholipid acyltransferase family protein n=1 Tax=Gracilibacillus massiliensis TaxID=1564956 RepID=UPI00071C3731|nr:lysophospholipid acyltransferase family protein [Gracilibacillus massiliensis]